MRRNNTFIISIITACYFLIIGSVVLHYENKKKIIVGDIIKVNEVIENLNNGGCGVFAWNLYQRLDTNRYSLKIIERGEHVMIFDSKNKYFIDSGGIRDTFWIHLRYGKRIEDISQDSLLSMINNPNIWNKYYDRTQDSLLIEYVNRL